MSNVRETRRSFFSNSYHNCVFLKDLQHDQEAEIKSLENEVQQMRAKHSESIQRLKAQFLLEKKQFQDQSDSRIETMTKEANQVGNKILKNILPENMFAISVSRITSMSYHRHSRPRYLTISKGVATWKHSRW